MVAINISYQGNLRCESVHAPSGTILHTDAPKDNMGQGESFSPTDLIAAALGTCMMTIMGIAAQKMDIDLKGSRVTVHKEMINAPTRRIGKLIAKLSVPVTLNVDQQQKLHLAAMSCPVHKSLHPDIEVLVEFDWAA